MLLMGIAAPWAVGILTEQQWGEATREVNAAQPFLAFSTAHYQRHFFSADVEGRINLRDPETGEIRQLPYRGTVDHGVTGSRLTLHPEKGETAISGLFPDEQPTIVITTHVWGAAEVSFSVPAIELKDANTGASVAIAASHGQFRVSDIGDHLAMSLDWPGMQIQAPNGKVEVSGIHFSESMTRLQGEVWTGSGHLGLAQVRVAPSDHAPMALTNLKIDSSVSADQSGERLDSRLTLSAEQLTAGDEVSGPFHLEFAVRNASVSAWNQLVATVHTLQAAPTDTGSATSPVEQRRQALQALSGALRQFAAAGVALGVPSLTLTTPEGVVNGRLMLRHPELPVAKQGELMLIMQRLTGTASLTIPAGLVASRATLMDQLGPLLQRGLVTRKGDEFRFSATLKDLELNINGKQIPLPPLI